MIRFEQNEHSKNIVLKPLAFGNSISLGNLDDAQSTAIPKPYFPVEENDQDTFDLDFSEAITLRNIQV